MSAPAPGCTVGGVSDDGVLASLWRAAAERLRIVLGREPPDSWYARVHAKVVRDACRLAWRGRTDWLRAVRARRETPGLDERVVELPWVYARLTGGGRLLDVGSTLNSAFHIELLRARFAALTYLNPYRDDGYRSPVREVSYLTRDARDPGLAPGSFGQVTCISTLEHVGCDNSRYGAAARARPSAEETRAARQAAMRALRPLVAPGGAMLMTVPYGRYEDHGWFVQLDAAALEEAVAGFAPRDAESCYFLFDTGWRPARSEECVGVGYGERTRGASAVACVWLRV